MTAVQSSLGLMVSPVVTAIHGLLGLLVAVLWGSLNVVVYPAGISESGC